MKNTKSVICNNFITFADKSGLSKKEIAGRIGVSESTLQRWKNNERCPEIDNLEKLSELFGVKVEDFFKTEEVEIHQDKSLDLISKIASLGPTELEILMDTLNALTKPIQAKTQKKKEA